MIIWDGDYMTYKINNIVKFIWIISLFLTLALMVNDLFLRIRIFPAEYVTSGDYIFPFVLAVIYYFTRKYNMNVISNLALGGFVVSLINKFGFMIGSILMW